MRILNDHAGEINGDVRFTSFEELDIIVMALNELIKKGGSKYTSYTRNSSHEKYAKRLSAQLLSVADKLANIYAVDTYYQEPKV